MKLAKVLVFGVLLLSAMGVKIDAAQFEASAVSASVVGTAGAGAAAIADDPSTVWYNPAGMTRLCGTQMSGGLWGHTASVKFKNDDSIAFVPPGLMPGTNGHDAAEPAVYGAGSFITHSFCNGLSVGLGINGPWGLVTDYGHRWVGRYHVVRGALLTFNFQPSIAYKISNCLSIGAGFDVQYMHLRASRMLDYGAIAFASNIQGANPHNQDGKVIVRTNNWGFGGNVGLLWEFSPCTRIGIHYRSQILHRSEGSEKFKDTPAIVTQTPLNALFQDTRVRTDFIIPDQASISVFHALNCCWDLMFDATWTRWKLFKRVRLRFKDPLQEDSITNFDYENTVRYAVGFNYKPNSCWIFRGGLGYEKTADKNKKTREPVIPGFNGLATTVGAGYQWNRCFRLDFAYAHVFTVPNPKIDKTGLGATETFLGGLKGRYKDNIDVFSFGWYWIL